MSAASYQPKTGYFRLLPGFTFLSFLWSLTSCAGVFFPVKKYYNRAVSQQPFDAIIVPGYPYKGSPWHTVVKMRVTWACHLYKKGYAKNIIFSGSAVYTPYIESRIMALYARAMGVPAQHLFTEERAEHSTENVYYGYCLARKLGFTKVAVATDQFQLSKLVPFVRKYELDVTLFPVMPDTLKTLERGEPVISDSTAYVAGSIALPDRESLYERLMGTLGYRILWCEQDLKKSRFRKKFRDRIRPCE